jgi:hypothetical protein
VQRLDDDGYGGGNQQHRPEAGALLLTPGGDDSGIVHSWYLRRLTDARKGVSCSGLGAALRGP